MLTVTKGTVQGGSVLIQDGKIAAIGALRDAAGLAAEGRSNRQIAQQLFITQATVETHLRHAFHKLGITSRADLPARLARGHE